MILFKVNSKSSIYVRLLYSMAVLCLLTALSSCSDDYAPAEIIPNPDSEIYFTKMFHSQAVMSAGVRCSPIREKPEKTKS